jgi:hypothetical protein
MAEPKICSIPDCGKKHFGRGFCQAHYQRLRKHGDPLGGGTSPGEAGRFINEAVLNHQGEDCLTWPFALDHGGYGAVWIDGKLRKAHRYVCELVNGPPPTPEHHAAHACGKGDEGCIAPAHLSWKTRKENEADKLIHGTRHRGEQCSYSKITDAQVREILRLKGTMSQREIGFIFGVSHSRVGNIHRHKAKMARQPQKEDA